MARVSFYLSEEHINQLVGAIKEYGSGAEDIISNSLKNEVYDILEYGIESLIPVSQKGKSHAKYNNPLMGDLEGKTSLKIRTQKNRQYLYFPDEAEGTSKVQVPHYFMFGGVENEHENAVNIILDNLIQKWYQK